MTSDKKELRNNLKELAQLLRSCKTDEELTSLLEDFLTPPEQEDMIQRWKLVELLLEGKTQREVKEMVGVSISKVSRGARVIRFGNGSFQKAYQKLKK